MKRRKALKRLLQASGGLIAATFIPACGKASSRPLFQFDAIASLEPLPQHLITHLDEFYVQSYALPPELDENRWQLRIEGAVTNPLKLSFQEILAAPQEDFYLTMECIGNPTGGNLIGNALWKGTPLLPFLQQAGVKPEAVQFMIGRNWMGAGHPDCWGCPRPIQPHSTNSGQYRWG